MAWIESHQKLERHPKLLMLCNETGWNKDEALGKLHRLWYWTLDYAEDGDLSKYDPEVCVGYITNGKFPAKKCFELLQKCNFIDKDGKIHDWLDYAGRYLHSKYHTSNPKLWNKIKKKHKVYLKATFRRPLGPNNLPNLTIPNLPLSTSKTDTLEIATLTLKKSFIKDKKDIYPMLNIEGEIRKCVDWHNTKGHKVKSWERAISNWLKIAYDSKGVIEEKGRENGATRMRKEGYVGPYDNT